MFFNLFILGCVGSSLLRGLSLVAVSGGYSSLWCMGFSLWWLLLLQSTGSRHTGFSSCSMRAQQLWCMGLVAPQHVWSSRTRDRTRDPCIGRWILNDCATGEVPVGGLLWYNCSSLWVTHAVVMGFDFIVLAPLLPSHCGFSFVFGCGVSFLVSPSVSLLMIVQQLVVIPVLSQEGVSAYPSTLPSWTNLWAFYFTITILKIIGIKSSLLMYPQPLAQ